MSDPAETIVSLWNVLCLDAIRHITYIITRKREQKWRAAFDSAGFTQDVVPYCVDDEDTTLGISELVLRGKRCPIVISMMADKDWDQSASNKNRCPVKEIRTSLG